MLRLALAFSLVAVVACVLSAEPRQWKDRSGKFTVEAEYAGYADGKVTLKKTDGTNMTLELSQLSPKDQEFVRAELKAARAVAKESKASKETPIAAKAANWPQWRGPGRDGISPEKGLLQSWPENGPPLVGTTKGLGRGWSSVAIANNVIYTMGQRGGQEQLIALGIDGKPLWSAPVGRGDHSNGTPTVDGDMVYAVGLQGDLVAAKAKTGEIVWRTNYEKDFGGKMMSGWGFSESPLIDGDRLICTPGAKDAMIAALDKKTGKVIWKAAMPDKIGNRGGDGAAYSSIVISNACAVKQYVQLVGRGVISVAAADGKFLWSYNQVANSTANIPTPIVKDDYVFCSTGYGTGSALLKITGSAESLKAEEVYFLDANQMQNHHGGMILLGDYLYCGHGHNEGFPLCIELATGKAMWKPGRGAGTGSASIAYADGNLYFRYQNGIMALIEANPKEYKLKGSFKIATTHSESWSAPVIAGGKLYLRDEDELHCYDISAK